MMTRSQTEKSDIAQLQESITALTTAFTEFKTSHSTAFTEFKTTQDSRHEAYLNTFQTLQTQLLDPKTEPLLTPSKPLNLSYLFSMVLTHWTGYFKLTSFSLIIALNQLKDSPTLLAI